MTKEEKLKAIAGKIKKPEPKVPNKIPEAKEVKEGEIQVSFDGEKSFSVAEKCNSLIELMNLNLLTPEQVTDLFNQIDKEFKDI